MQQQKQQARIPQQQGGKTSFNSKVVEFMKDILQQRGKRKALIMDSIPFFCFWLFFIILLLSICVVFFFSLFTSSGITTEYESVPINPSTGTIQIVKQKVSPLYGDATLSIGFPFNRNLSGIFDPFFDLTVVVNQKIWFIDEWFPLVNADVQKLLMCDPRSSYCNNMVVLRANPATMGAHIPLMSRDFQFVISLGESFVALRDDGYLTNAPVDVYYSHRNAFSTMFEILARVFLGVLAGWIFLGFAVLVCVYQSFFKFHTMQKWLLVELFLHFWFQNPFYFIEVFLPHFYFFPMINFIISNAFIFVFLLHVLVFFHSIVKHPKQRNFCTFYVPKTLLVFGWFVYAVVAELYTIINNVIDPTSTNANLGYFHLIGILFFIIYVMFLLYYVVRACGFVMNPSSQTLQILKSNLEKIRMEQQLAEAEDDGEAQPQENEQRNNKKASKKKKPQLQRLTMQEEMIQKRIDKLEAIQKLQKRVHAKYSTRFFFVGALCFLVLFSLLIQYFAKLRSSENLDFLPNCYVIGVFFFAMAVLYLPSSLTEEEFLKIKELKKARRALRLKKYLETKKLLNDKKRNGENEENGIESVQGPAVLDGPGVPAPAQENLNDENIIGNQQQPQEMPHNEFMNDSENEHHLEEISVDVGNVVYKHDNEGFDNGNDLN